MLSYTHLNIKPLRVLAMLGHCVMDSLHFCPGFTANLIVRLVLSAPVIKALVHQTSLSVFGLVGRAKAGG